jgi:hypothetical protein
MLSDFVMNLGRRGRFLERKPRLGIVGAQVAAACAVLIEAPGDFEAPFGLRRIAGIGFARNCSYRLKNFVIFDGRDDAEGTTFCVIEQKGATLRADAYHWSVLRCGVSSGTRES